MSNVIDSIQLSGVTYAIQGSGGKAIEAGRGISITTGETADTVSFNLPISAGTGTNSVIEGSMYNSARGNYSHAEGSNTTASGANSHAEGKNTRASGNYSHVEGSQTEAKGAGSHAEGFGTIANNQSEHASGLFNNSVSASTTFGDSGNTLFSVGNGTATNARHNAFEIRQNGDIYLSSGGTDIKLQDHLGGGGGGNPTVELTQAEYDALVTAGTVSPTTYYIITDAQAGDLSQYWTSAQTNSAITQATSGKVDTSTYSTYTAATDTALGGKQATLVSGTNIKTINNESILGSGNIDIQGGGGGGKAVSGGTNISITTGETADTINCTLPMKAEVNNTSIYFGTDTWGSASGGRNLRIGFAASALGQDAICLATNSKTQGISSSIVGGRSNNIYNNYSFIGGGNATNLYNQFEASVGGQYNNSVSASTTWGDSGNTLFSVGNGTSSARHNAFEIRQNGDIYLTLDGQDVKLQDQLGGGSITVDTALDSGSTNPVENRVIYNKIDEVEQVTAAALNNINDRLSEDEEVTAAALNALNDRIAALEAIIQNMGNQ
jgi:hypothetical protein